MTASIEAMQREAFNNLVREVRSGFYGKNAGEQVPDRLSPERVLSIRAR